MVSERSRLVIDAILYPDPIYHVQQALGILSQHVGGALHLPAEQGRKGRERPDLVSSKLCTVIIDLFRVRPNGRWIATLRSLSHFPSKYKGPSRMGCRERE